MPIAEGTRFDFVPWEAKVEKRAEQGGQGGPISPKMRKRQAKTPTSPSPSSPTDVFAKLSLTSPTLRKFDNAFIDPQFACRCRQYDQCSRGEDENNLVRCWTERFKGPSVTFIFHRRRLTYHLRGPLKVALTTFQTLERLLKADTRRRVSNWTLLVFNVGSHALKIAAHDHFYGLKAASVGLPETSA
ncbi:hypothetical protein ARMGADRAFT_569920 [Armillaria gallica]|uniref:Uncharacterized protein n=1 Tax=Armillaria gallica TaxID=47427 RepID=A0A2H3E3A1_ARMGA|nr:hypothetical protein ARMGADRAFT_569920 [Armillaria gallica]